MIMASPSIYRPIDGLDTIRLIRLLKGAKHYEDDPIRCELFEAPLPDDDDDEAYYEALSYTWGDASQTRTIFLDGRPATVTANLHQALRHLRLTDEDRIIWVDAVCINQGDHSERMHQVGKMGNIYKKAREVIIWLGIGTKEIDLLLDAVLLLDKQMLSTPKPPVGDPRYLETWLGAGRRILAEMEQRNVEFHRMRARGLEDLLGRGWWSRIWVVQEAANAPRARIQCSWRSVPTRTFALMPQLMGVSMAPREQVLLEVLPGPLRKHSWWYSDRSLETLLVKFQHSQSKEECDQIYALLGMSSEAGVPGCSLQADYSLDMTRIVQNTVSFLAFGELVHLEACPLPSWDLSNLRNFMPSLKANLLAWALVESQVPLLRKLLLSQPPHVVVNDRLPNDENLLLPAWLRYLLPPPIFLAIASERYSAELLNLLFECEDLDVNVAGFAYLSRTTSTRGLEDPQVRHPKDKFTPLSLAARLGRLDLIRLLSERPGIKLRQKDPEGFSPLERTVESNEFEAMELLIALDRDVLKDEGWRLLHQAIELNRHHILERLLSYEDIDVNRGATFFTPLSLATSLGHHEQIRMLFARQDLRIGAIDPTGSSPLKRAFQGNKETAAELLIAQGGAAILEGKHVYFLRAAIEKYWVGIIRQLTRHGVSPDATSTMYPISPLAFALQLRNCEAVQALLEAGADPDPSPPTIGLGTGNLKVEMWCPIVSAIRSCSLSLLEVLMNTGKGAHKTTWKAPNEDPLIYAIRERHAGMVKLLLARGANVEAKTANRQMSCFWLAVEYKAPQIMRLLADSGADFNISARSHAHIYQGPWSLKSTPWFDDFLVERQLFAADVCRIRGGEAVLYTTTQLTKWEWENAGSER